MHKGKTVIMQPVLELQKSTQCINILNKLLSKFHNFWSPFSPLLPFISFKHACKLTGAKQSFHIPPSYPFCRSTNMKSIATEFAFLGFLCDL